jgi:flagellar hook-length control protein FliK
LAALAESRTTGSAAATDASDGADAVGAAAVAGATLTDDSLKGSAATTAAAAQVALLQGVARTAKHDIDAAGTGTGTAGPGTAAGGGLGAADAAAGVSQPAPNAAVAPDAAPTPTVRVAASVDSAEFPQELSSRVSWMVDNNMNGAKLQVNPPSLGPIELRILVSGDHAQVWMSSHSAVTRDALESSTPKLREMLGTQGFSQVSVDISQRSFQDRSAYSSPYEQTSAGDRSGTAATAAVAGTTTTRSSLGVVDAYA